MRRSTSDRLAPILVVGGALAAFPTAVGHFLGGNKVAFGGGVHFYGVGSTALAAAFAAVALTVVGARRRDGRTVLLGTAFSVMAALLALHGIATPYFLIGDNGVVSFTGGATLPIGGAILALSAIPRFRRQDGVKALLLLQASLLTLIAVLGFSAFAAPSLVPAVPEPRGAPALALLARSRVLRAARVPCVPDVPADPPACRPPGRRRDRLARRRAAAGDAPDLHGARLVARSRLRARRDRPRRRAGGPRSPPLGSVKTARRRPRDRRARPLRGGIPRLARPCAHSLPRGEGRLHRGAHTPRRAPGRPGRRGARPLACPAPRARDGRARPSRLHGSCSEDEALGILASEAGTKRDRRCVAVLVEIVAAGPELALEALAV